MRRFSVIAGAQGLILALSLGAGVLGAQVTTGAVNGTVVLEGQKPAAGVQVIASGDALPQARLGRSNARGEFSLRGLPAGEYVVLLRLPGFRTTRHDTVAVRLGQTTTLPTIVLVPGEVTLAPIVVAGAPASVDVTSAATGMFMTATTLRALPQERDVASILAMIPQHNASPYGDGINVAGSTGYESAHYVDGAHVTDPVYGNGAAAIPYNFVREIQVRTGGYEAEFGRSMGGIVNVLTHSGGNEFRSEAFGFFTNNRFSGERLVGALERAVNGYSYYDAGISLGGPIRRDRAWFFVAYNPGFTEEQVRIPSFPGQTDRRRRDLFAGKVTWQPGSASLLQFSVHGDPSRHDRVGVGNEFIGSPDSLLSLDPVLGALRQGGVTLALTGSHNAGSDLQLDVSIQRGSWRNRNRARGNPGTLVVDPSTGLWSGGYGITVDQSMQRASGALAATWSRNAHLIKGGIEVQQNVLDEFFAYGTPAGTGGYRFERGSDDFTSIVGGVVGSVRARSVTGFLQDGWAIRPGLRVNAGVRWDGQLIIDPAGRTAERLMNGWQPRLGVILQPRGTDEEKVFATAGRFHEQLGLGLAAYQFAGTHLLIRHHAAGEVLTVDSLAGGRIPGVPHLRGEYLDEYTLGWERMTRGGARLGTRLIARRLRDVVEDAYVDGRLVVGNPGRDELAFLPRPRRNYMALEFTIDRFGRGPLDFAASYVLSSNRGNHPGVYDSDNGANFAANFSPQFDDSLQLKNADGPLPNDRTHVLKWLGAWRPSQRASLGATIIWQSGTPLSVYGQDPSRAAGHRFFLHPRGSAGRTPALVDLNLRFMWEPVHTERTPARLIVDFFHLASRRSPVLLDQVREFSGEGNPRYGRPIQYQSPMSLRVGITVGG